MDTFSAVLLEATANHLTFASRLTPRSPVRTTGGEVVISPGDIAIWFLIKHRTYDIARVYDQSGRFSGFYVDALEPVEWIGDDPDTLEGLVDLFLDIWIWPDRRFEVLDLDELESARQGLLITDRQAVSARRTVDSVVGELQRGLFPPPLVVTPRSAPLQVLETMSI